MPTSRRTSGYQVVVLSLLLSIGGLAIAAPAGAGTKWTVVSSGKATGSNSLANTNTEVMNPVKIEVTVTGPALVQWSMDCVKGSKVIMTKGKTTLKGAGAIKLKVAKSSNNCQLAANALNGGPGQLTLSIKSAG